MYTIPTLKELYDSIIADLETEFAETIPVVGPVFLRVIASVQAAKLKLYYLGLAFVQKQIFADTADSESVGGTLERFGRVKLGRNPFPAVQGVYSCQVTGTVGASIPEGTIFIADDSSNCQGKLFILDDAFTLSSSPDTIHLRALEAGSASLLLSGNTLTCSNPLLNVDQQAMVFLTDTVPSDAEDIEEYRKKVVAAYRLEPQGGSAADYRLWSFDVEGVKQVYPYAKSGAANEIDVFVESMPAYSTDGKGTPDSSMLTSVLGAIQLNPDTSLPMSQRARRPLGVFAVNVLAITVKEIDIIITNYTNITTEKEDLIESAITDLINKSRPFISTADDPLSRNDVLGVNNIINAIMTAAPGYFAGVEMQVNGTPTTSLTLTQGNIPHLNSISYV